MLETVRRFQEARRAEKTSLPIAREAVERIDSHLARLPIVRE